MTNKHNLFNFSGKLNLSICFCFHSCEFCVKVKMNCVSLKNLSFLKIHEEGLFKCDVFEKFPPILKKEFHEKMKCCFFSYGQFVSIESIQRYCKSVRNFEFSNASLYEFVSEFVKDMCLEAARNGHLKCFMFSMENGIARTCWRLKHEQSDEINGIDVVVNHPLREFNLFGSWLTSFQKGHLEILLYGVKMGKFFCESYLNVAAYFGHLNILLCQEVTNGRDLNFDAIISGAVRRENMEMLVYCFEHWKDQITQFIPKAIKDAFKLNKFSVLMFFFTNAKEHFSESVWIDVAFYRGNEEFLKFGLDNGLNMTKEFLETAAERGNVHVLIEAIERKIQIDESVWVQASVHGNLNILLCPELENEVTLDYELIIISAAEHGHIHVLEYCFEHWKDRIKSFMKQSVETAVKFRQTNALMCLLPHAKKHFTESVWVQIASFPDSEELMKKFYFSMFGFFN